MDKKETKFEEQDHPLKNTDKAFVQVGSHGEPVIPTEKHDDQASPEQKQEAPGRG
jgi:hypothetical protein